MFIFLLGGAVVAGIRVIQRGHQFYSKKPKKRVALSHSACLNTIHTDGYGMVLRWRETRLKFDPESAKQKS